MKPIEAYVFCAVNKHDEIVWVCGSQRIRYFASDRYLQGAVEHHNEIKPNDPWRVVRFRLVPEGGGTYT